MMDRVDLALGVNVVSDPEKLAAMRMRMLRLGEGWSAATLSRKYKDEGVGGLTRNTIAKIESDKRRIKAGEVEGVAKVFGLTAADLLNGDGPKLVLSYAEQDAGIGHEVAAWLADHGFPVLSAGPPAEGEPVDGPGERRAIDNAQAFVVLLSAGFLSSPRCQEELKLAVRRKQQLASAGLDSEFIYVLRITDVPDLDNSALKSYPLVDLDAVGGWPKEVALSKLGGSIISSGQATAARPSPSAEAETKQAFLERGEELEHVLYTLSKPTGPHFWLVTSPPGLGKSRFLQQLAAKAESASVTWVTKMVEVSPDAAGRQPDAATVIRMLFDLEPAPSSGPEDDVRAAAQQIVLSGQPWLRLLDGAELLPASAVAELRRHLGKINRLIQDSGSAGARLAFVVASRLDNEWRGLVPSPGLSILPLKGFGPSAVQVALAELADRMPGVHSPAQLRQDAAIVQRVTEGVPTLVLKSLQWIQEQAWLEIGRLADPPVSDGLIEPYVKDQLLAPGSLLPGESQPEKLTKQLDVLRRALRALVPYRLFTQSHLREHMRDDPSFKEALERADWSEDDLWQAIADTALLYRPLDEPWREFHPAVRRLLFRFFYPPGQRAEAHARAREFTRDWASQLTGKERAIGMVESIWHEAVRLRLDKIPTMGADLTGFVRNLAQEVSSSPPQPSLSYSDTELLDYAVQRMLNDAELQHEVAGEEDLLNTLVQVVREPAAQEA
jgi:transcriptional regulator with XRE-family HTH domain